MSSPEWSVHQPQVLHCTGIDRSRGSSSVYVVVSSVRRGKRREVPRG